MSHYPGMLALYAIPHPRLAVIPCPLRIEKRVHIHAALGRCWNFRSDLWSLIRSQHYSRSFAQAVFPLRWNNRRGQVPMPFSDERQPALKFPPRLARIYTIKLKYTIAYLALVYHKDSFFLRNAEAVSFDPLPLSAFLLRHFDIASPDYRGRYRFSHSLQPCEYHHSALREDSFARRKPIEQSRTRSQQLFLILFS